MWQMAYCNGLQQAETVVYLFLNHVYIFFVSVYFISNMLIITKSISLGAI